MTRHRIAAALALVVIAAAGCGDRTPDYTSLLTTTPKSTQAPTSTTTPVPISQYLEQAGVTGQPVAPDKLTDLTVTMPSPKGWQQYSNPSLAPGTRMIAKGDTYPTAMLMVFQLSGGDFDPAKAISARQRRCRDVGELPKAQRVDAGLRRASRRR